MAFRFWPRTTRISGALVGLQFSNQVTCPECSRVARFQSRALKHGAVSVEHGESEVLTLARSLPNHRAMVDDAAARACPRTLGIPILGTGGALVLAKRRSLIPSVATALQALREAGLWLSDDVEKVLRQQSGE